MGEFDDSIRAAVLTGNRQAVLTAMLAVYATGDGREWVIRQAVFLGATRTQAEDIHAEVLRRIWASFDHFDMARGYSRAYVRTIIARCTMTELGGAVRVFADSECVEQAEAPQYDPVFLMEQARQAELIDNTIRRFYTAINLCESWKLQAYFFYHQGVLCHPGKSYTEPGKCFTLEEFRRYLLFLDLTGTADPLPIQGHTSAFTRAYRGYAEEYLVSMGFEPWEIDLLRDREWI